MEFVVREFAQLPVDDLYEILRLRSEVFVVEQDSVYQDIDGADRESVHVYMRDGGRIVAYLRVIRPGVICEGTSIGRVLTVMDERRKGLGRMLMIKGIEVARRVASDLPIEIKAQTYLTGFYESLGFRICSDPYIHEGRPHITMQLA